jgi:hypothetical protein
VKRGAIIRVDRAMVRLDEDLAFLPDLLDGVEWTEERLAKLAQMRAFVAELRVELRSIPDDWSD